MKTCEKQVLYIYKRKLRNSSESDKSESSQYQKHGVCLYEDYI